jgi:UDP-N-acetylglucosamine 2-epimerase
MQQRGIDYELIDSGQHATFASGLRKELGVKEPDIALVSKGNIKSVGEAARWFLRYIAIAILRPSILKKEIFTKGPGLCVIHGDTPSTLLSLILAKRAGLTIAHIEAGLRSWNLLRPFPEELIRIICMRFADLLFAPSDWALGNLRTMKVKGQIVNLGQNTNVEALYHALETGEHPTAVERPYCLMTIHRVETILRRRRLKLVVEIAESLAKTMRVVFVLHDPTRKQLEDQGLLERIVKNEHITSTGLIEHAAFLNYLVGAEFVITDGGSIQEEAFYLDVPCLVLRRETERTEGLDANVQLAKFDRRLISAFLAEYRDLRRGQRARNRRPSEKILVALIDRLPRTGLGVPPPGLPGHITTRR